jgi:transcriptional regulator with XRE-family HTH domain
MHTKTAFAKHRQNTGLKLREVAAQFKVDRTTILRWETGTSPIPDDRLEEIEAVTGISRHALRPDLAALFAQAPKQEGVVA